MRPEYRADFSRFLRMISCVFSVVFVIQQGICSTGNIEEWDCLGAAAASPFGKKLKNVGGSSPNCFSHRLKSMDRWLIRQGVPVLKRPTSNPSSRSDVLNSELESAILPPARLCVPTWSNPRKNVPDVMTTAFALK